MRMLWYLCYFAMDKMKALRLCRHMFVSVPAAAANTYLQLFLISSSCHGQYSHS